MLPAPAKKSPLKALENEEESDGRADTSLAGEVREYKFMEVVRVGDVVESKDDGALIGELVSEWFDSNSNPSSVGEKLAEVVERRCMVE